MPTPDGSLLVGEATAEARTLSPVGDTARAFAKLAAERGITLNPGRALPWLTNRGHAEPLLAEALAPASVDSLRRIFMELAGDEDALAAKRPRALGPDFLYGDLDQLVELDESQHFTTARLRTLDSYSDAAGGFDVSEYRALCERLRARSDRDFAHKQAAEFPGLHGRQRQRAYFDAVRDFGAPSLGHGAVIRVPAPERDADLAVERLARRL